MLSRCPIILELLTDVAVSATVDRELIAVPATREAAFLSVSPKSHSFRPGTSLAKLRGMARRYEKDIRERAFRVAAVVFKLYPKAAACGAAHGLVAYELLKTTGSVAANLEETAAPSSRKDMAAKYAIALREGRESRMWARLLAIDSQWTAALGPLIAELGELIAMMNAAVIRLRGPAIEPDGGVDQ